MKKMKQITLATSLSVFAMITPNIAGSADLNQIMALDESTPKSSISRNPLVPDNNRNNLHPSSAKTSADQAQSVNCPETDSSHSCPPPRWTVSAEAIILNRISSGNQTLIERVPGDVSFSAVPTTLGAQTLNSHDFHQGISTGPQIGVTYQGDSGYRLDLSYFQVINWDASRAVGPDTPLDWLVMRAPGGFFQTQDFSYQTMAWDYATQLYNAEVNVRKNFSNQLVSRAVNRVF